MIHWKDFFLFQKSDRRGLATLLAITVMAVLVIDRCGMKETVDTQVSASEEDSLLLSTTHGSPSFSSEQGGGSFYTPPRTPERFVFDPNTADSTQLLRLGLRPWQVRNIYKYRAKGGIYRKKEDFARLYGLTVKEYRELEPYIRISDDYRPAAEVINSPHPNDSPQAPSFVEGQKPSGEGAITPLPREGHQGAKLTYGQTVSLSRADTIQLQRVPGIGSYFARRIVEYRERLGGFYDVSQLMEIEGFPEKALDYIDVGTPTIKKLKVNELSVAQLRRHPYISFYQAKAIEDYRRLYGPLTDIGQLALLKDFTDDDIHRLKHYLEY